MLAEEGRDCVAMSGAQCRGCGWPSYLPDPKYPEEAQDPELDNIKELLAAGRFFRAFLFPSDESSAETRERTEKAINLLRESRS